MTSFFNGAGNAMSTGFAKIPYAYTGHIEDGRHLVIMECSRRMVAVALRSNKTDKIGRVRYVPVSHKNGQAGFKWKNTFIFFSDVGIVI